MSNTILPPPVQLFTAGAVPPEQTRRLANGITLHWLDRGEQPVARMTIVWPCGPTCFAPGVDSIALEMLREGTERYSSTEIADIIDYNGAVIDPQPGTHYSTLSVTMLTNKADAVLELVEEMLCRPTFPEHEMEVVRQRLASNRMIVEQRVLHKAKTLLESIIAGPNNPCAHETTAADLMAVTREQVVDFYKAVCGPEGCHVFVSGQVSEALLGKVTATLEKMPHNGTTPVVLYPYEPQPAGRTDIDVEAAVQAAVCMAMPSILRTHPDYIGLHMVVRALGGYFGSRLMANIREEKGYTYGITAGLLGSLDGTMVNVQAECDARYVDAVIEETAREFRRMVTEPPRGEELYKLKVNVMSGLLSTFDSPFATMQCYISKLHVGLPDGYFERQQEVILEMKPEDFARLAERYLDPSELRIVVAK